MSFLGLTDAAESLARGDVSSGELVETSLARIRESQPVLNAFRCVREEAAVAEAQEADRRLAKGERRPLLGVPVAIKDDVDLAGETTPFGCLGTFDAAAEDCEAVRRLRDAGAVIVGKTTTPELGQWLITEGDAFGVTRNPWSLEHTPGGSSGGSAAAVAAGVVPAALGSDGLGSVRIPAAWTHLIGIKPQRGRISTWPETVAFHGLTCIGPLARTVADAALLLDGCAGNHPEDRDRPPPPRGSFLEAAQRGTAGGGRRLRIAVALKPPFTTIRVRLDPEIAGAVERLAAALGDLGHEVTPARVSYGILGVGMLPRSLNGLHLWCQRLPDQSVLDKRTRENAKLGGYLGPLVALGRALEAPMRRQIGAIFKRFDVILAPTSAQPALSVGGIDGLSGWETDKVMTAACPYTWPWNVTGWPSVNVPAGLTSAGLPIGAQLMGPACSEELLIELAAELEVAKQWQARTPPHAVSAVGEPA